MIQGLLQKKSRWIAILHDVLVIPFAWFGAYWLRFNLDGIPDEPWLIGLHFLPKVMIVQTIAYWYVGLYRGIWRFASIPDLIRIVRAVLIGSVLVFLLVYSAIRFQGFPRSVLPLYAMLLTIFLGGARFSVRLLKDYQLWMNTGIRVLVVGAEQAGEGVVRDLLRDKERNYKPVAFVDSNGNRRGQEIQGIRVVGDVSDILKVVKKYEVQLIIIAMPSASAKEMRTILQNCEGTGCTIRTLPGLSDLVSGRVSIDLLREVSLEDLLGRDPVSLDWQAIRSAIVHKTVLISGAGGSIGSELCRQVAHLNPSALIVVERSEYNLFMLEQEFSEKFPQIRFVKRLLDILDQVALENVFSEYHPEIIFHAAAYKHVPMLETQPREAVINNILGTHCLGALAIKYRVEKFILVSTDKAVNPTNIMGASKRVAEMVCDGLNGQGKTQFSIVRFGNVLGSAGSVVPTFRHQLEQGGPLTVTHPDITRFFMTIPEACQLILQAFTLGKGGEIFVLDMGEPIKIQFLAEQMIRLAGKKPGEDIEIRYTGLRPGEKLYEELFHPTESLEKTTHQKIFQAKAREYSWNSLVEVLEMMEQACDKCDEKALKALLHQLVPELETKA